MLDKPITLNKIVIIGSVPVDDRLAGRLPVLFIELLVFGVIGS